jgi:hypothetical protein
MPAAAPRLESAPRPAPAPRPSSAPLPAVVPETAAAPTPDVAPDAADTVVLVPVRRSGADPAPDLGHAATAAEPVADPSDAPTAHDTVDRADVAASHESLSRPAGAGGARARRRTAPVRPTSRRVAGSRRPS